MMNVITANERHLASNEWQKSYNLLSFGDYYDPNNAGFGPLKVFNESYLAPKGEVPDHAHHDVEILTLVLEGSLTHRDSLGNDKTVDKGEAYRISAGLGMTHREINLSEKNEVRMLQLWFKANTKGLNPSYEQKDMDYLGSGNELIPVATGQKVLDDVIFINSNSTVYYANLSNEKEIDINTFKIRSSLIYVLEGSLFVNGVEVEKFDQLRLTEQDFIKIIASADATFVLVDVPAVEANY
jgi:quercetin 2,3-dioxygenase